MDDLAPGCFQSGDRDLAVAELNGALASCGFSREALERVFEVLRGRGETAAIEKFQRAIVGTAPTPTNVAQLDEFLRALVPADAIELNAIAGSIVDILRQNDAALQRQMIEAALLRFGLHLWFILDNLHTVTSDASALALGDQAYDVAMSWRPSKSGEDADPRRAFVARDLLVFAEGAGPWIAEVALSLIPSDEIARDEPLKTKLLNLMQEARRAEDFQHFLVLAGLLLLRASLDRPLALELIADLEALSDSQKTPHPSLSSELRIKSLFIVAAWYLVQASRTNQVDEPTRERNRTASKQAFERAKALGDVSRYAFLQAMLLEQEGQREAATDLLANISDNEIAGKVEVGIRLALGDYQRVIELLQPIALAREQRYLLALKDEDIERTAQQHADSCVSLAFSHARLGRWGAAVTTLDRCRSLRLRHGLALRRSDAGHELLKLEAVTAALARGAPSPGAPAPSQDDPLGQRLTASQRTLDAYRKQRPELSEAKIDGPSIQDIGGTLKPEEAVVSLGLGDADIMVAVLLAGDTTQPSHAYLLDEIRDTKFDILYALWASRSEQPYQYKNQIPNEHKQWLVEFLAEVDAALCSRIAAILREKGVKVVTFVSHRLLHIVPFWALPSLVDMEVRTSSSLAHWYEARHKTAVLPMGRATIVGNPTLDLRLASVEANWISSFLRSMGCDTEVLLESGATENEIRESVRRGGLLHFAGHGLARDLEPRTSGLLTHPDKCWGWPHSGDPFATLVTVPTGWESRGERKRYADVAEGRLTETFNSQGMTIERRLEYASRGTLWGQYFDGELLQLAELWTTGDMLVEESLLGCSLAYLGACGSGRTGHRPQIDEDIGLASALQVSGVDIVVGTCWPVDEVPALLFAQLFYQRLLSSENDLVNVAQCVAACRRELASLRKADVVSMLRAAGASATTPATRAQLDIAIQEAADGPERPFEAPWEWAAFFFQGPEHLRLDR